MVKHELIAYRDRARETIRFDGDAWRQYVPIAVPWTVCVRDRLPAGSAAVLINRAHAFTDLILPISAAEDRMLATIDGKRTLGEIVEDAGGLRFFERLWEYDHVAFDGSREARAG
jgi:hypothetical protein